MRIEHLALYVNDLEAARIFFVKYLGGISNDGYYNNKTGFKSYFISFDDGARLEIMNKPGLVDAEKDQRSEQNGICPYCFFSRFKGNRR